MKEFQVKERDSGQKCVKYCMRILPGAGSSFFYKMLRKKNITVNDKKADPNQILNAGDVVKFYLADDTFAKFEVVSSNSSDHGSPNARITDNTNISLIFHGKPLAVSEIIYEDEHILLYNKPAGLLSQKAEKDDVSVNDMLLSYLFQKGSIDNDSLRTTKPSICNRLDRNTSGLIICGKSYLGLKEMNGLVKDRSIGKYYHCIVKGKLDEAITLKGYLYKDHKTNQVKVSAKEFPDSSYIETEITPLHSDEKYSLLEVHLITGKTHQIRSHLASIQHPIIGDYKYGDEKANKLAKEAYGISHQMLHAYRLVIPTLPKEHALAYLSGKEFIAPKPSDFVRLERNI